MIEKRTFRPFLPLALISLVIVSTSVAHAGEQRHLTLLVTSDIAGQLVEADGQSSVAALAATVHAEAARARSAGRAVAVLDAGRTLAPYAESRFDSGATVIALLKAMDCRAFAPSAIDLSAGAEALAEHQRSVPLPIVMPHIGDGARPEERTVIDMGDGITLEVFNVFDPGFSGDLQAAGLDVPVPTIPSGSDDRDLSLAIVRSYARGSSLADRALTWSLVEQPEALDLLIDPDLGHDLALRREGDDGPVFLVGRNARTSGPWSFSKIDLSLERSDSKWSIADAELTVVPVDSELRPDPNLEDRVRTAMRLFRESLQEPLPEAAPADRPALEHFVFDTMIELSEAEVAILNRGALRPVSKAFFKEGHISREAVVRMLSLDQRLVVASLTGKELQELAAESARRTYADGTARKDSLHLAGVTLDDDGATITKVNGRPLYAADAYRIVTNGYLYSGGDDYDILTGLDGEILTGDGGHLVELRDQAVLPRLDRADDAFVDLEGEALWRYGVDHLTLSYLGIDTSHDEAYLDVRDTRARAKNSTSLLADLRLWAHREATGWRWENDLKAKYGTLETDSGKTVRNDDLVIDTAALFTAATLLDGHPYVNLKLDSEIKPNESDGERLPRQFEQTLGAGMSWKTAHWPRLRLAAVGRHYSNVDRDEQLGVSAEAWYALKPGGYWPEIDLRMLGEVLRGGDSTIQRYDFDLRLKMAITGTLFFTPGFAYYVYDDSTLPGSARYRKFSLGLTYAWSGKHQTR